MFRPALIAVAAILPALTMPTLAAAQTAPLAQVSQHLRGVTTMTADFIQTDRMGKSVGGVLSMKRPGKVRFQYQKGVPLTIVGDGKALTVYDSAVRQESRWPIGNSPLAVLLDPSKDLTRIAKVVPAPNPRMLLVEARDPKHPEFGTTTIAFDRVASAPGGLTLMGWSTLDAQGNRSAVRLSNQRFNGPVDDRLFRWTNPRRAGPRG
ncbi:LolA family protein [Sphingomonas montana]|uniref:LolA family protein n=1 Tax=Sphingomonas montana TaxID=1843236 RepID=UPI00096FF4EC|nr:outer membrane lipoprotein carrier protein LolA [Sphingomonas montana]